MRSTDRTIAEIDRLILATNDREELRRLRHERRRHVSLARARKRHGKVKA